jgi:amino acid permease
MLTVVSSSKWLGVAIVGLVGVVAVVVGVIYLTVEGKSLPSVLGTLHGFGGHRSLRGIVALVVGLVLLAGAGWLARYRPAEKPAA